MSTLTSAEILNYVNNNQLITEGFEISNLDEVCYEARTSNSFFNITNNSADLVEIKDNEYFILRPNNQVVCVTMEYFDIPLDVIARVALVGHYFSLGIAPVSTYADPGFKGKLGIVLTNTSKNYLKIKPRSKIAKIEFSCLAKKCKNGYNGQHGSDLSIWPFRKDIIASNDDLKESNINPNSNEELERIYGKALKDTIKSAENSRYFLAISTLGTLLIPLVVIWGIIEKWNFSSPVLSIALGVVAGLLSNLTFFFIQKKFR